MNKIKVMTVFGTRPEAIKMAPLVHALEQNENTESIVCVTAQHREMLDQVLDIFDIKPDYDLNIMQPRQTLATITEKSLHGLDEVLEKAQPDIVLVHLYFEVECTPLSYVIAAGTTMAFALLVQLFIIVL